jgi:FKBP-type peptidyl-prolyl cis-trans isomerase
MKKLIIPAIALAISINPSLYAGTKLKAAANMSDAEKQSYAAGFAQGGQLKKMDSDLGINFKMDYFQKGFDDAYGNKTSALDDKTMENSLVALQQSIMDKQRVFLEKQFTENKQKGEEFLAKVKKENKVKELTDGVLYEVVKAADSKASKNPSPALTDTVKVSYKGTTIDGKEFDSNEKVDLSLGNLIKGWQTALQKMHPGDKWKLYIPAAQAYGERGAPGIMPNSTLVFDIELHEVVKEKAETQS